MDLEQFIEAYHDVEIDEDFKTKLKEEFYEEKGKEWISNSERALKQTERQTNFSKEEIKYLQEKFIKKETLIVISKEEFKKLISIYF